MPPELLPSEGLSRDAFHRITAGRLAHLSLLHAFERDMTRCRTTAKSCSRKHASKAALLRAWESLELAVIRCLQHFDTILIASSRSGSIGLSFEVDYAIARPMNAAERVSCQISSCLGPSAPWEVQQYR